MNTLGIKVSYEYAANLVELNWSDIHFGIKQGFIPSEAAIQHALRDLEKTENPSNTIIDLAWLNDGELIYPYIEELALQTNEKDGEKSLEKFLYIVLSWVLDNKELYSDPLEVVEIIYADFDYPEEVAKFVRYMPADEPSLGTMEENLERIYNKWRNYLNNKKETQF